MEQSRKIKLSCKGLGKTFKTPKGDFEVLRDLTFDVYENEFLVIFGPGQCGKTTLLNMLAGLEPSGGTVFHNGKTVEMPEPSRAMVYQTMALFPWMTVMDNVAFSQKVKKIPKKERAQIAQKFIDLVGLTGFEKSFPIQLSGGMKQRVVIAIALACSPKLLIADEPTTALDVTIQAQILDLLKSLQKKLNMSIIIITHDLGVISEMADEVVVMYAGEIVEKAKTRELFDDPKHPYTVGLMNSVPDVDEDVERLRTLEGLVPSLYDMPKGCRFAPRCQFACPECEKERIKLLDLEDGRQVRCRRYEK